MDQAIITDFLAVADRIDQAARVDELAQLATMVLAGQVITPFTNLHRMPKADVESYFAWSQPGNVGNKGGGNKVKPHGSFDWIPASGLSTPAIFSCQAIDWDNFYLYMRFPNLWSATLPSRLTMVHVFGGSPIPIQAIEWQCQITDEQNRTHNMAFQLEVPRKEVSIYDKATELWEPTKGIPFPDFSNPVTVVSEFALDPGSTTHVAISFNGVRYPIGTTKTTVKQQLGQKYTTGIQIDPKKNASCLLDVGNARVTTL